MTYVKTISDFKLFTPKKNHHSIFQSDLAFTDTMYWLTICAMDILLSCNGPKYKDAKSMYLLKPTQWTMLTDAGRFCERIFAKPETD